MDRETREILAIMGGFFLGIIAVFIAALLLVGPS
ncbi:hypothetical protein SEA_PUREGLOBE5_111 [Arthrobacter phage Pureglobe5]|nr:hypothetical protein SEA_PUREGLOBE5_111 [Arthrobacter phage Pureglobe5]